MYKAYFDASFNKAKGMAAVAYVIYDPTGITVEENVRITVTNDSNYAEWIALTSLLKRLKEIGVRDVEIFGDNSSVIDIANGKTRKAKNLALRRITRHHSKKFDSISFNWISRRDNGNADKLSRSEKKATKTNGKVVDLESKPKHKNKINTYTVSPKQFDFNFKYKEGKRKAIAR